MQNYDIRNPTTQMGLSKDKDERINVTNKKILEIKLDH